MDIKEARIGQWVHTVGGVTGKIAKIDESGYVTIGDANNTPPTDYVACIDNVSPVSDPCASCEMAATITSQCEQIAELQRSVEAWTDTAARHCRNESYYRDELYKLQKEALECKPLGEVAQIYIQVSPDKLLMSQEARRIIEYIAQCTPSSATADEVFRGLPMDKNNVLDALAEARDAGKIALVNGKYEIVRD